MEFIKAKDIITLANPGVVSRQLLNPDNSPSERVTLTKVYFESGGMSAKTYARVIRTDLVCCQRTRKTSSRRKRRKRV